MERLSGSLFFPGNIRLNEDVFSLRLQKTSWRRLDQDEYVRLTHTSLDDVFKTSSSRSTYSSWSYVFKTSSRRFQDVLKTSSRRVQDILRTSSRRIIKLNCSWEHNFKTSANTIIYWRFAYVTLLRNLWSVHKIHNNDKNFSSFNFSFYYTL